MARLTTPAWLVKHTIAVAFVAAFLGLGWWQLSRATGGNSLSWAYTFEWPVFALFVIGLWIREVRDEFKAARGELTVEPPLRSPFQTVMSTTSEPTGDTATDAYNRYLAWLSADPQRKPSEFPG